MTHFRLRVRSERGAAAVEFALIATILFILLFGIIEFGRVYSKYTVLTGAAREGARFASVRGITGTGPSNGDVAARIAEAADPYSYDGDDLTVSPSCSMATSGSPITVQWSEPFEVTVPLLPVMEKTVVIKGVFRCE